MTEERNHAILFAATLVRPETDETIESDKPNLGKQYFVDRAIQEVELVMERLGQHWPELPSR